MAQCMSCGAELAPPYRFCSRCGQPASASGSPRVPSSPAPEPARPGQGSGVVLVVVAVLIMVGAALASAGVLYLLAVAPALSPSVPPVTRPVVSMTLNTISTVGADLLVNGIQPATSPTNLKVNIEVNASFGTPTALGGAGNTTYVFVAGNPYAVIWQNVGGSGNVAGGDHFVVVYPSGAGAPSPGTTVTFFLIWSDGSTLATVMWQV